MTACEYSLKEEAMRSLNVFSIITVTFLTVGCGSHYYRVTDPASGKTYLTKKVDETGRAGTIQFKDERTGGRVTLQSSEVKEISEGEYESGLVSKSTPPTSGPSTPASPK
jgi:hypothetical protein